MGGRDDHVHNDYISDVIYLYFHCNNKANNDDQGGTDSADNDNSDGFYGDDNINNLI